MNEQASSAKHLPDSVMPPASSDPVASETIRLLQNLHQLTLDGCQSQSRQDLIFRILNNTIALTPYDRAVLWGLESRKPRLLGVSGRSDVNRQSPAAVRWRRVVGRLAEPGSSHLLSADSFPDGEAEWEALAANTPGLSVLWTPLSVRGKTVAGLWLERWSPRQWTPAEKGLMDSLMVGYGIAWGPLARRPSWLGRLRSGLTLLWAFPIVLILAYLLLLHPIRLRIAGPCQVLPKDPLVVTAPLDGVVERVAVEPGMRVENGHVLFHYDKRVPLQTHRIVQQQVEILESQLARARLWAFRDEEARSQIPILQHRLEQERARLRLAGHDVAQLEVKAAVAGVVMIDDPNEWRGRPVAIGERVMRLVDPGKTKLRIWVPENDNIDFNWNTSVKVFLNVRPERGLEARLCYVSRHVTVSPQRVPSFIAEAEWSQAISEMRIGLKGTAILYGEEVCVGYWIVRNPWAALRRLTGI